MIKQEWQLFMDEALLLAEKAGSEGEVPVGSVIVKDGKIIAEGRNEREAKNNPLGHAEVIAIKNASEALGSWRLEGCTLVTTLEPCLMCLASLQQARIERVIYAANDSKGGALSLNYKFHEDLRTNHRFPVERLIDPRAEDLLKKFFRDLRSS